jgi:DNA-binding CsgD family transcriptional regulator
VAVVVGVDGSGRTHRLRELAAAAGGPARWVDEATDAAEVVLVVDDPHRLDDATLRAVTAAARAGATVLLGRRPTIDRPALADLDAAVAADGRVEQLTPLDDTAVARIVGDALGRPSTPDETARARTDAAGLPALVVALAARTVPARIQRKLATSESPTLARVLAVTTDLSDSVLAAATGVDVARGLRALRDEGFLTGDEQLIPAVAEAIRDDLAPAERRRLHDSVARALLDAGGDPLAVAAQLRAARARTPAAAGAYLAAGERLRLTDPAAAVGWYDDAVDAGADPADAATGRAEAAAQLGMAVDLDAPTTADATRRAVLAGVVEAQAGRPVRAAEAFLAAPAPGPALAVPSLVGTGRLNQAVEAAKADAPLAVRRLAEAALTAGRDPAAAVPLFIEAAEQPPPALLLPDTARALGALVAVTAGDTTTAEHLLERSAPNRDRLLLAWARMRAGRYDTAVVEGRRPAATGRDALLSAALQAGLARRSGDIAKLREAWQAVEPALARQAVDLFHAEPLEELAVAAVRLRQPQRFAPVLDALDAAVHGLGDPPPWVATVGWIRFQCAVAADDAGAARTVADRLAALDPGTGRQRAQAAAAVLWARSLADDVDPDAIARAADALAAAGLPWEASRLAGHAAIRTTDAAAARRLLEAARDLSAAEPTPVAAPTNQAGLSEREVEVARLVLDGRTHKEIGAQLYISPKTVEHHVARIRTKVGATDRAEFVAALRRLLESTETVS